MQLQLNTIFWYNGANWLCTETGFQKNPVEAVIHIDVHNQEYSGHAVASGEDIEEWITTVEEEFGPVVITHHPFLEHWHDIHEDDTGLIKEPYYYVSADEVVEIPPTNSTAQVTTQEQLLNDLLNQLPSTGKYSSKIFKPLVSDSQSEAESRLIKAYLDKANEFTAKLKSEFKPNGNAALTIGSCIDLVKQVIHALEKAQSERGKWQKTWENQQNAVHNLENRVHNQQEIISELQKTHFDIKQFNKFCKTLYKTVDIRGPEINEMADLPRLTDFMYTQICKNQVHTDEVP